MINNVNNLNLPVKIDPTRIADKKKNEDGNGGESNIQADSVSISAHHSFKPISDPVQVNMPELNPFKNKGKSTATAIEGYVQGKVQDMTDYFTSDKKKSKMAARIIGAAPSGFARSLGEVADTGINNLNGIANNVKVRIENVKEAANSHADSALKQGLSIAGSIVSGTVGIAAYSVAAYLDMKSSISGIAKRTVFNAVDNLEGTKTKSLPKSESIARKVDVKIQKLTDSMKAGNGVVVGTALGLSAAVGGAMVETVAECLDMGKLVYKRMGERAAAKGVNYSEQKKTAWDKYETSDKGFGDKVELAATRLKQGVKKVADVRIGDVLRSADSVMKVPKRMVINTARNIGDIF